MNYFKIFIMIFSLSSLLQAADCPGGGCTMTGNNNSCSGGWCTMIGDNNTCPGGWCILQGENNSCPGGHCAENIQDLCKNLKSVRWERGRYNQLGCDKILSQK